MNTINEILELHDMAIKDVAKYDKQRFCFDVIKDISGKHFLGITGLRGSGKSVILKQLAALYSDSIYISIDSIGDVDIFELIKKLYKDYKIKIFLLDEVHFCRKIDEIFKKIYDFLDVKVVFTSSVSLGMFRSAYDLSRRVRLIKLFNFSYREYLYFSEGTLLPTLSFEQIKNKEWMTSHLKAGIYFERYLKGGNVPFSMEEPEILPLLGNILQTIIFKDIPRIAKVTLEELDYINKTVSFIGKSEVDGINYSSISRNVGITKFKAAAYIELLQQAFVIHRIMPAGTNVLKEPKILLAPPFRLLFRNYEDCIGALREEFFVEMMTLSGFEYYYLKSTRGAKIPDYLILKDNNRIVAEIGGKGKGREQFKGIKDTKNIIFSHSDRIDGIRCPLFMAGFLSD